MSTKIGILKDNNGNDFLPITDVSLVSGLEDISTIRNGSALGATAYQKPSTGIPASDLESSVQASLGKADTALQSFTETDPTVPSWAKQQNKPSYNYSEIGNTPDLSGFITKSVNDLTNYYLKSETYTKTEVATLIGAIQQFHYEIYPTLPASGETNVLYLIGPTGSGADKYEEYVYTNNAFTKIGDTSIDLSGYVTTSALNTALASYATTQDLEDSKVFWAEVDVTTFAEIKDAIDAGRTVMLKDENGYIYAFSYIEDTYVSFTSSSGEECSIRTYNVWDNDSYELFAVYNIESQDNRVTSISSSSNDYHYPSAKAVYDIVSTKYTKPQGGIPASDLASGVIPTVPTNVSAFTNDAGYLTQHQSLANYVQKSQTAGLLKNDGTVDTNTYLTQHQSLSGYATETWVEQQNYLTQHQDISGKADKITVASSMPSGGFLPNVVYNLGTLSGNTTFSMAAATDNTIANIWCWTFTTPSTAPTITWPAAITGWSGGSIPTINASKSYEITVMNGLATIIES